MELPALPSLKKLVATPPVCQKLANEGFPADTHFKWIRRHESKKWHLATADEVLETPGEEIETVLPAPLEGEVKAVLPSYFLFDDTMWFFESGVGMTGETARYARNVGGPDELNIDIFLRSQAPRQADACALLWIAVRRGIPQEGCHYIDYEAVSQDRSVRVVSRNENQSEYFPSDTGLLEAGLDDEGSPDELQAAL